MNVFIETITAQEPLKRHRSLEELLSGQKTEELLRACDELDAFRRSTGNLYEKARACCMLHAIYRFQLQDAGDVSSTGVVPYGAFEDMLARRFGEAVSGFKAAQAENGPNAALFSALAHSYRQLTFQILSDQVRRSVRATRGNQWMFRIAHPDDHPIRIHPALLKRSSNSPLYNILIETTPVRLDLSHSGWSDIFFLGMDYPEGARVLNISVDLGVHGRDVSASAPISVYFRVISEPVIRLTSVDLASTKDVTDLNDLFNFGNDYLSLLKAGVIASGLIPPSFEGSGYPLRQILDRVVGPGMGFEVVTSVNDIPKGSRLAVSTNLLAAIIAAAMRGSGQTSSLTGSLTETQRRIVASRAILGEWLGGSGGGWQDSGGIWPAIKLIQGALAQEGDPEFGVSAGRLLPEHRILSDADVHPELPARLSESLVLVHGGLAQNVGPILEMVTERYLLRQQPEWQARQEMRDIFNGVVQSLKDGDVKSLAMWTTRNWEGPLKTIIPWVTNSFTETLIARSREKLGADFWGFLMLGGMSGGGMALFVAPQRAVQFRDEVLEIMRSAKRELDCAMPFAMEPVVYDFRINEQGSVADMLCGLDALMPVRYYGIHLSLLARSSPDAVPGSRRVEFEHFVSSQPEDAVSFQLLKTVASSLFRASEAPPTGRTQQWRVELERIKADSGFDDVQHEQMRQDLRSGRIGLARNRLPLESDIEDVSPADVTLLEDCDRFRSAGVEAIREGAVAVLSLAGGIGSRWTSGAGVIKALNPFAQMAGHHRSFLEIHLAKTRRTSRELGAELAHLVSTSYLTHAAIAETLHQENNFGFTGPLLLSPGRAIGQRLVPMVRDLTFLWEDMPQETLDEQKQKVRDSVRGALLDWARNKGEGSDYTDNLPGQCLAPAGHWYEVPNMLRSGVLLKLLKERPQLRTIILHNIDTLGAAVDPAALGWHLAGGQVLSYEVVPRRMEDRGGGLARINGRLRLLEGLAQPREDVELRLRYYNTMTTWIQIDELLRVFGLTREELEDESQVIQAIRNVASRLPTYVTVKDVKYRWGHGQEDIYPVAQFEKLWGDMTTLSDVRCGYLVVDRRRGQQLKDPAELDAWVRDGSRDYIESLCDFDAR
ncbi:MAG: UTP--glucose-1-phosphate uridylyltransferase [Armatimonadetes bacterium]|nr:UTP--glucose-1-phosphate uridylyltransferase [Armatimonadota bacterium]